MSAPRAENAEALRIGVLGAARITELALVEPARATGHRVVAVAARSPERATAYAGRHGIECVHGTYAELLADPEIEAVYNPLANGLHGRWNLAAARAGKHVLAEKPAAADAQEARDVAAAVRVAGTVHLEAFHYPYHPLFRRVVEIVADGGIGEVRHVEAVLTMTAPAEDDPRWSLELAGGSTMDLGCYSLSCVRLLGEFAGGEPTPRSAVAAVRAGRPGVDERLSVELDYPSGATARAASDMAHDSRSFRMRVVGSQGEIAVPAFPLPHEDDTLVWTRTGDDAAVEHLGRRSSYTYQLETFANAVRHGGPVLTDVDFTVANMTMIDTAYELSGLEPRCPTPA